MPPPAATAAPMRVDAEASSRNCGRSARLRARGARRAAQRAGASGGRRAYALDDELAEDGHLQQLLEVPAQLHQHAHREEPEHRPRRAQRHLRARRDATGGWMTRSLLAARACAHQARPVQQQHGGDVGAHAADEVARDQAEGALLLLHQLAEHVQEEQVA
eukprot:scaffold5113_cov296-Prasinococcus_capsulatus_cf.AAC.2